jgi:hypothetical protein
MSEAPVVITVTDPIAIGQTGDSMLSLAEAIELANGNLRFDALSDAERACISGMPGRDVEVEIRFAPAKGMSAIAVARPPAGARASLPALAARRVTLDGAGVTLRQAPAVASELPSVALLLTGSDIEVRNLAFEGFAWAVMAIGSLGDGPVENIAIVSNRITVAAAADMPDPKSSRGGIAVIGSDSVAGGSVCNVRIESNLIINDRGGSCIVVHGALAQGPVAAADGLVDGIEIVNTDVVGGVSSIWVCGGQAMFGGTVERSTTRRVQVVGNRLSGSGDCPLFLPGGSAAGGGVRASRNVLEDVTVAFNDVVGYMALLAGDAEMGLDASPAVDDNTTRRVTIRSNRIAAHGADSGNPLTMRCLFVAAGNQVFGTGSASTDRNRLEDVSIRDNIFERGGMGLWGGFGIVPAGSISDNATARIEILDNALLNVEGEAVLLAGAGTQGVPFSGGASPMPDNAESGEMSQLTNATMESLRRGEVAARFADNRLEHVLVDGNVFANNAIAVCVHGAGSSLRTGDALHRNVVERFSIGARNRFSRNGLDQLVEPNPVGSCTDLINNRVTAGQPEPPRLD